MVLFYPTKVAVELYVPCSEPKDDGLFLSLELVDLVLWVGFAHVSVHHSACGVSCPVVEPFFLDVGFDDLDCRLVVDRNIRLRESCTAFSQCVRLPSNLVIFTDSQSTQISPN